jgi:uncharacterized membrane protein YbhN (UPF0104 family)
MAAEGRGWRIIQTAFVVVVLAGAAYALSTQWAELRAVRASTQIAWSGIALASALVFLSYAVLIATWRATVQSWGERIGVGHASYIWFVSNLGRYVPGKVWQIGAMGVLAQHAGVAPVAAVGSALVVSLVHLLVGFAVVAATGAELLSAYVPSGPWFTGALVLLGVGVVASPWLLPMGVRLLASVTGRKLVAPRLPPSAIWLAAGGSALAWTLFGLAFHLLSAALLGRQTGDAASSIAVFTLSYQLGFVFLFAPGGIGVREVSMQALLVGAGAMTVPEALWLVVASRLWLTVLEILPGSLLLLWPDNPLRPLPSSATE